MHFRLGNHLLLSRCLVEFPPEISDQVPGLQVLFIRITVLSKRSFEKSSNPSFIILLKIGLVSTPSTGFLHWVNFTNDLTGRSS